jgi:phosphomevalonate kinase
MRFSASAPGKAVLSGEYAVLQGAPAISMAVDCRARVTAESTGEDCHKVLSPGFAAEARFRCTERGTIEWLDEHMNGDRPNADQVLFEYVWRTVQAMPAENLSFRLDTRRFFDTESSLKLGFGSSSALAAALAAVLVRAGPAEATTRPARDIRQLAIRAHLDFQGGKGSGVDVATAMSGGLIAFAMRPDQRIKALKWPAGIDYLIMWSGKPASTAERLRKLERFERNRAARTAAAKLVDASRGVLDAWIKQDPGDVLASLQSYTAALRRFSLEHRVGVFDAGHQELCEAADDLGFVYKPCGAGGGDIGIVFLPAGAKDTSLADFGIRAGQLGFRKLDRTLDPTGLMYEH